MPDSWLETLLDESIRMGAAVAVILLGAFVAGLFVLNKWRGWYVSAALLAVETRRADKAEQDAAEQHAEQLAAFADRLRQVSEDHGRALAVMQKILDSKDKDIESWRLAWSVSDQAGREEDDARWDEIRAAMQVMQRWVTEIQRQAAALEARRDGGTNVGG